MEPDHVRCYRCRKRQVEYSRAFRATPQGRRAAKRRAQKRQEQRARLREATKAALRIAERRLWLWGPPPPAVEY